MLRLPAVAFDPDGGVTELDRPELECSQDAAVLRSCRELIFCDSSGARHDVVGVRFDEPSRLARFLDALSLCRRGPVLRPVFELSRAGSWSLEEVKRRLGAGGALDADELEAAGTIAELIDKLRW